MPLGSRNMILSPKQAMRRALKEAKKGLGWVEPNPPVGCVILSSENQFLASGYHKKYGGAHAEVEALNKIRDKKKLKGAKLFVTLEPCHHQGKTPSCAKTIAEWPFQSLTYGAEDPCTRGRGLRFLEKHKISVYAFSNFKQEMENLIAPFTFSFLNKKAFVSLKLASSLNGVMALKSGESQWITGERAREHAHFLRAVHPAVLIGVNTFLKDRPRLNIRLRQFKNKQNTVLILDPKGKSLPFLPTAPLLKERAPDKVVLFCSLTMKDRHQKIKQALNMGIKLKFVQQKRVQQEGAQNKTPVFDLPVILSQLYQEENIQSVLVEGGAFCLSQFLSQNLAQKLYLYVAPRIMGPGLHWSDGQVVHKLSQSRNLHSVQVQPLGEDVLWSGFFLPPISPTPVPTPD